MQAFIGKSIDQEKIYELPSKDFFDVLSELRRMNLNLAILTIDSAKELNPEYLQFRRDMKKLEELQRELLKTYVFHRS